MFFSKFDKIAGINHLRNSDSLFQFRGKVCMGSHILRVAKLSLIWFTGSGFFSDRAKSLIRNDLRRHLASLPHSLFSPFRPGFVPKTGLRPPSRRKLSRLSTRPRVG